MNKNISYKMIQKILLTTLLFMGIACTNKKQAPKESIQDYFKVNKIGADKNMAITAIDTSICIQDTASYKVWESRIVKRYDEFFDKVREHNSIRNFGILVKYRNYCAGITNPRAKEFSFVVKSDSIYKAHRDAALTSPNIVGMGQYVVYEVKCSSIEGEASYYALCSEDKVFLVTESFETALFKILFQDSDYKQFINWCKEFPEKYESSLKEIASVYERHLY